MASIQSRREQQKKAEQERLAIERFCELYGQGAQVIKKNNPPAPDYTIRVADKEVFVELTRYLEKGPHLKASTRDLALRCQISDRWRLDDKVRELSLFLYYRESGGNFKAPQFEPGSKRFEKLFSSLKALAEQVDPWSCEQVIRVRFVPGDEVARYSRRCRRTGPRFVPVEDYRILDRCFRKVMFRYHPGVTSGLPKTSLSARATGVYRDQLKDVIAKKTKKLQDYRETAGDCDIWLLVYSEGWLPYDYVNKEDAPRIVDCLRQLTKPAGQGFDRVFWCRNLFTERGQDLCRII